MTWCVNCDAAPRRRNRRCDACAAYLRRNGRDRPVTLLVRYQQRKDEQRLARAG
jgi:hypothetical protein